MQQAGLSDLNVVDYFLQRYFSAMILLEMLVKYANPCDLTCSNDENDAAEPRGSALARQPRQDDALVRCWHLAGSGDLLSLIWPPWGGVAREPKGDDTDGHIDQEQVAPVEPGLSWRVVRSCMAASPSGKLRHCG